MKTDEIKLKSAVFDGSFLLITLGAGASLIFLYYYAAALILPLLLLTLFLWLGFGLPRWMGDTVRRERALRAKKREMEKWGFYSRDRRGPWINYIAYPLIKETAIARGKYFYSEWLIIHDGMIIVNPGPSRVNRKEAIVEYDFSQNRVYAWDGCSPKIYFFWFLIIGTPDWWPHTEKILTLSPEVPTKIVPREVFWQKALHASLVHDALYQYLDEIPIAKKDVDMLFYQMLRQSGSSVILAAVYRFMVRVLGGRGVRQEEPLKNSDLKIKKLPLKAPADRETI